jgi:hypothetical protein
MKTRLFAFALAIATTFAFTPAANVVNATPTKVPVTTFNRGTAITTPVTGSATNTLGQLVNFVGNFSITKFVSKGGQLFAVGTLTGTLTNTVTGVVQQVSQLIRIPVTNISGSCQILHLELGPLDLDLLGLQVHLDKIVLDITAQSGPGNLLGNLLCAVANLLNGQGSLASLAQLLNQILAIVTIP